MTIGLIPLYPILAVILMAAAEASIQLVHATVVTTRRLSRLGSIGGAILAVLAVLAVLAGSASAGKTTTPTPNVFVDVVWVAETQPSACYLGATLIVDGKRIPIRCVDAYIPELGGGFAIALAPGSYPARLVSLSITDKVVRKFTIIVPSDDDALVQWFVLSGDGHTAISQVGEK